MDEPKLNRGIAELRREDLASAGIAELRRPEPLPVPELRRDMDELKRFEITTTTTTNKEV